MTFRKKRRHKEFYLVSLKKIFLKNYFNFHTHLINPGLLRDLDEKLLKGGLKKKL